VDDELPDMDQFARKLSDNVHAKKPLVGHSEYELYQAFRKP
jgi:hypothetical protein